MPRIEDQEKIARKILPVIYVLDTSGSMRGERIAALNAAMHETVEVLKDVSASNPTAEIKIGVMKFSSQAEWVTDSGLIFMDDFYWNDLAAGGLTELGEALTSLGQKLSRNAFLSDKIGYKAPVILFISDGRPTGEYEAALAKLQENKWFQVAAKIALAFDLNDTEALAKVTGDPEAVIEVSDLGTLRKLIRVVSVTAAQVGSVSHPTGDTAHEVLDRIKEHKDQEKDKKNTKTHTGPAPEKDEDVFQKTKVPDPVFPEFPDWD